MRFHNQDKSKKTISSPILYFSIPILKIFYTTKILSIKSQMIFIQKKFHLMLRKHAITNQPKPNKDVMQIFQKSNKLL